jgi:hypothetical protein
MEATAIHATALTDSHFQLASSTGVNGKIAKPPKKIV